MLSNFIFNIISLSNNNSTLEGLFLSNFIFNIVSLSNKSTLEGFLLSNFIFNIISLSNLLLGLLLSFV